MLVNLVSLEPVAMKLEWVLNVWLFIGRAEFRLASVKLLYDKMREWKKMSMCNREDS